MNKSLDIKDWYVSNFGEFEKRLNGGKSKEIHHIRKEALNRFGQLEFPTQKDEEWKYTNISPLLKHNFVPSSKKVSVGKEFVKSKLFDETAPSLIVFVNGHYAEEHTDLHNLPKDVVAGSLSEAIKNNSSLIEKHFTKYAHHQNDIFTALSTAYTDDGAFIYVPDGKIVEKPVHIIYITSSDDNKIIIQRLLLNLIYSYEKQKKPDKVEDLKKLGAKASKSLPVKYIENIEN